MYKFTKQARHEACVHEAAHAVVFAIGGVFVERLAVAPEGAETWSYEGRIGGISTDLWGMCEASRTPAMGLHVTWDEDESAELVMPDIRQGGSAYSSPLI